MDNSTLRNLFYDLRSDVENMSMEDENEQGTSRDIMASSSVPNVSTTSLHNALEVSSEILPIGRRMYRNRFHTDDEFPMSSLYGSSSSNESNTFLRTSLRMPLPVYSTSFDLRDFSSSFSSLDQGIATDNATAMEELSPGVSDESVYDPKDFFKCSVCLRSYVKNKPTSSLCGHVFCFNCIRSVLNHKPFCPICKQRLRKSELIRLFL